MLRKRDSERHFYQKVNGYAPEKVVSEFIFYPLNGYAPEKNTWFGHYVHFFTILWTNEHQKQAIMPPSGVDYASEFLNGYAPEYVGPIYDYIINGHTPRSIPDKFVILRIIAVQ